MRIFLHVMSKLLLILEIPMGKMFPCGGRGGGEILGIIIVVLCNYTISITAFLNSLLPEPEKWTRIMNILWKRSSFYWKFGDQSL